jgi:hypothetical protein
MTAFLDKKEASGLNMPFPALTHRKCLKVSIRAWGEECLIVDVVNLGQRNVAGYRRASKA